VGIPGLKPFYAKVLGAFAPLQPEQYRLDARYKCRLAALVGSDVHVDTIMEAHLYRLGIPPKSF